jgi:alpha-ketoglutarate-dependent taurine dioxygenase
MAKFYPPEPGRPQLIVEQTDERGILDLDHDQLVERYREYGALLLRGFGVDIGQFRGFARRFCSSSVINESPGRQPIDSIANIHTVDGGVRAFNLHPELSREPWKPDIALFGCLSAPSRGGETTICDGVALVHEMPETVRRCLEGRRLLYIKPTWPALLEYWLGASSPTDAQLAAPPLECPYFFRRIEGEVLRVFTRPALHRPMFIDKLAFGNFLLFARFNNGRGDFPVLDDGRPVPEAWLQAIKATGARLSVPIDWRPGDVLVVDNTRFMHGRKAIIDPGERLIATYFGYLNFARPDPEEPVNAPWRRPGDFYPPIPPDLPR